MTNVYRLEGPNSVALWKIDTGFHWKGWLRRIWTCECYLEVT